MNELLAKGIAAARAGEREKARQILIEVLRQDWENEQAWLWLSTTTNSPRESLICLRQAFNINPQNPYTREGLRLARARLARAKGNSLAQKPLAPSHASLNHSEAQTNLFLTRLLIILLSLSLILGFVLLIWAVNVRRFI